MGSQTVPHRPPCPRRPVPPAPPPRRPIHRSLTRCLGAPYEHFAFRKNRWSEKSCSAGSTIRNALRLCASWLPPPCASLDPCSLGSCLMRPRVLCLPGHFVVPVFSASLPVHYSSGGSPGLSHSLPFTTPFSFPRRGGSQSAFAGRSTYSAKSTSSAGPCLLAPAPLPPAPRTSFPDSVSDCHLAIIWS